MLTRACFIPLLMIALSITAGAAEPSPDLNAEKQALAQMKAELDSLAAQLRRQGAAIQLEAADAKEQAASLPRKKAELEREAAAIENVARNLESERNGIELRRRYARTNGDIQFLNYLVDKYNARLGPYRESIQNFQRSQDQYNDLVAKVRAALDQVAAKYESHDAAIGNFRRREAAYQSRSQQHTINVAAYMKAHNIPSATSTPEGPPPPVGKGEFVPRVVFSKEPKASSKK